VIEEPQIRRYLLTRFPYSIYYRWNADNDRVSIYALMHTSRRPGYWRDRLKD
jgi:toxin ParE1/3/4